MLEVFDEKSEKNRQKHHFCDRLVLSVFLGLIPREIQMGANIGMPVDSIVVNDKITPNDQKHKPIEHYEGEGRRPNPQIFGNELLCSVIF